MTLVSWRRPNCHVTECHMTLQVSHDTSVTVTFEVSHDVPPEPVMRRCTSSSSRLHRPLPTGTPKSTEGTENSATRRAFKLGSWKQGCVSSARALAAE